ncbi:MAG: type II secretion system protein [Azovibrio sp.]|uniref:type II secretion system protein n=1 Tax=Azovibrio sp. TaxID=1872673 RepID=UPI003C719B72
MPLNTSQRGFSLTELAVVMIILSLLVGGLIFPLAAQRGVQQLRQAETGLAEIREALLGFAAIHGHLPCPDTDTDPATAGYGEAESTCNAPAQEGFLPFKSLGLQEKDPWEQRWRYRVDRNFAASTSPITLATHFGSDSLLVKNAAGDPLTTTLERPIAIFYSFGPNQRADGGNASFAATNAIYQANPPSNDFDDLLHWLARPTLISRLIASGRLL